MPGGQATTTPNTMSSYSNQPPTRSKIREKIIMDFVKDIGSMVSGSAISSSTAAAAAATKSSEGIRGKIDEPMKSVKRSMEFLGTRSDGVLETSAEEAPLSPLV